jgi:hypothetical protein
MESRRPENCFAAKFQWVAIGAAQWIGGKLTDVEALPTSRRWRERLTGGDGESLTVGR